MYRFHCVLLINFLALVSSVFAADDFTAVGSFLENGYYKMANLKTSDSPDGIYLYVDDGWNGTCWDTPHHSRLYVGKNLDNKQNENIWVLTDRSNKKFLNSELKKGNRLSLESFTKLEFDSLHNRYLLAASDRRGEIEFKPDEMHEDTIISDLTPENYFSVFDYILYQNGDSLTALCGFIGGQQCFYKIGCFYRNDSSLVFDSLPNLEQLITGYKECRTHLKECSSFLPANHTFYKLNNFDSPLYKINGAIATKKSSNIVIENKRPKLQLKGNH